ncbi:MAG: hypothetical protein FD123_1749 [Bacteroidetes bacterium]|nr:MAG: hypothetical protein FD123_1749 [Bacteroidota bacterium]
MEELHALIHSLSRQQIKVLKKYLVSFSTRNESESRTWDLAQLLLKSEKNIPTLNECSIKIYNHVKDSRIEKLKSRLHNKVFDSLMIDINVERKGTFDELDQVIIKVLRKSALYQTLRLSAKSRATANEILDEIISVTKKYEMYGVLADHLKHKKWGKGWRQGFIPFNKINEEISFYEYCSLAVGKATDYYYKMLMHLNFEGNQDKKKYQEFLREAVADMTKDFEYTKSAVVGHYLKLLEMAYAQSLGDYSLAKRVGEQMLELLINNLFLSRKSRIGSCYDNIAECDIYLGNYESALQHVANAQRYFAVRSPDYYVSKEQEFFALFYMNGTEKAKETCQVLLSSSPANLGDFRFAKYTFYNACVLFKQGLFRECSHVLRMKFELTKDRLGWEIAIRVLRIMAQIELEKHDEVQLMIHSLQKHIERNVRRGDTAHERDRMILKVFQLLEKEGFRKGSGFTQARKLLAQLAEKGKPYSWIPLSPELIPVHEWVIKKFGLEKEEKPVARGKAVTAG